MTRQAMDVLMRLKKAQVTEDGTVYINFETMTAQTCHDLGAPFVEVSLAAYRDSIHAILADLKKRGLLEFRHSDYIELTHAAFHIWQTRWSNFCGFVMQSVLTPIIVTILTTIVLRLVD